MRWMSVVVCGVALLGGSVFGQAQGAPAKAAVKAKATVKVGEAGKAAPSGCGAVAGGDCRMGGN